MIRRRRKAFWYGVELLALALLSAFIVVGICLAGVQMWRWWGTL